MKLWGIVTVKVRLPEDKTIEQLKAEIKEHIQKGEFWIKDVQFRMQED